MKNTILVFLLLSLAATPGVFAGEADVRDVKVSKAGAGQYSFSVSVAHADTGWEHYANKWDVVTPEGAVLATRVLHHPHVQEQPFARSLSGVDIPTGTKSVVVRAHDSVHGYGGETVTVALP